MSTDLETEEVVEAESNKFDELFNDDELIQEAADEETTEDTADSDDVSEGETVDEVAGAKSTEGPTIAMQALARQHQIPDELIEMSRDDAQLQEFIKLAQSSRGEDVPEEKPAEAPFEITLPEDEYGEEDPLRKELARLNTHHEGKINELKQFMQEVTGVVRSLHEQSTVQQQEHAQNYQIEFDRGLDELDSEILGSTGNGELGENHLAVREAVWARAAAMQQAGARGKPDDLARQAAKAMFPTIFNQPDNQQDSSRKQAKKRLGTGTTKAVEPAKSEQEKLFAKWDKILKG